MSRYDFTSKLNQGNRHESELDEIFRRISIYQIFPATPAEQRQGIDRWFISQNERFSVEYKSDERAGRTGNGFIEIVSVDQPRKDGWAYTSLAEMLMYWNVLDSLIYVIQFDRLRERLQWWRSAFPTRSIPNRYGKLHWNTIGLLVPLDEFERISDEVINL